MFDEKFLIASMFWGSVGVGYFVYGKKQRVGSALAGGILMMAAAYLAGSAFVMSLACIGIAAGVYALAKRGY